MTTFYLAGMQEVDVQNAVPTAVRTLYLARFDGRPSSEKALDKRRPA